MKLCILDLHQKSLYLGHKLAEAGFELSGDPHRLDYEILMVDTDHPMSPPVPAKHDLVKAVVKKGIPVVLYPHGGPPDLDYDGLRKSSIPISLQLLHGEGHAEIYRRCGFGHRFEAVGWTYGPVSPPPSGSHVESVLFAPIHPWANGRDILPHHRILNRQAYEHFVEYPAEHKTVLQYGEDEPNGVNLRYDNVRYFQSGLALLAANQLVSEHDAVISYGTLAYAALAQGKPVAMIGCYPPYTSDDGKIMAAHFDDYKDFCCYPAEVGEAPLDELFARDVSEWRNLFVGGELDVDRVTELLQGLRPSRAVRRALARA